MKPKKPYNKLGRGKNNKKSSKKDILYFLPIIAAIALVPLIVHLKVITLQGIQKDFWTGESNVADFFNYYKFIVLILASVAGVFSLFIKKINSGLSIKKSYTYIPLIVYAFFVLLSTVLSQYKDIATGGFVDRYEGMYALLGYVVLVIITINLVENEMQIKYIINALLISSTIIGLIGMSQFLGIDFFSSSIGKSLILPPEYQSVADGVKFRFAKNLIYATLYNPNYVGTYVVLVVPICLSIFIFEKNIKRKILTGLLAGMLLLCLFGSQSMAGYIGLIITVTLMLIFFRRNLIEYIRPFVLTFIAALILIAGLSYFTGASISKIINISGYFTKNQASNVAYVKDIILKDNIIKFVTDKQNLSIEYINGSVNFYGDNGELLTTKQYRNSVTFENQKYSLYRFQISDQGLIDCFIGKKTLRIAVFKSKFKLIASNGELIDVVHPDQIGFSQQESIFSARGFIWSRTIPLLKDTILIGHGPDTYPIYFPQKDLIGKLNAYGRTNVVVDKPHNLYLQIAMNTGVVSMLAFIALLLMYAVSSFKLYLNRKFSEYKDIIGVSLFCAICGYSVTGLANDSVLSVAPVFWVLLGLGIACNLIIYKGSKSH